MVITCVSELLGNYSPSKRPTHLITHTCANIALISVIEDSLSLFREKAPATAGIFRSKIAVVGRAKDNAFCIHV